MIHALGTSFVLGGKLVGMSCSVGVALYPADAGSAEDLVKNADMALYRAKADGRGTARFYEGRMDEALRERRLLEADLHLALGRDELSLHFQPLANLDSGEIIGFEALLRWHHPVRGEIGPDRFIPLAEESGFIAHLGAWVLRRACAAAARWSPPLRVAVNLSPVQFTHGDLAAEVERILAETGLEPGRSTRDNEGVMIKDPDARWRFSRRSQSLGVGHRDRRFRHRRFFTEISGTSVRQGKIARASSRT